MFEPTTAPAYIDGPSRPIGPPEPSVARPASDLAMNALNPNVWLGS